MKRYDRIKQFSQTPSHATISLFTETLVEANSDVGLASSWLGVCYFEGITCIPH